MLYYGCQTTINLSKLDFKFVGKDFNSSTKVNYKSIQTGF